MATRWYLNPETLMYESQDDPRWKVVLHFAVLGAGIVGAVILVFWLYIYVFGWDLPKTARLKKEAAQWQSRIEVLNRQLDHYEETLEGIEERDEDVYRSIYGLGEIPRSLKSSALGGVTRYQWLADGGASTDLRRTVLRVDDMVKRTYVQSNALDEVGQISRHAGDMLQCVPSVPPLAPDKSHVHLSSSYGYRRDPVYGGSEFHRGQDFAAPKGTPVYSTGDGTIVKAEYHFGGYGNQVMIDHGFGYTTRYAHLSSISVNEGMKVKRGERIGSVGNSGKSTGPHLHYEVFYRGNTVNPWNYMDFTMPLDDYRAMVDKRREDSPFDKKSSTTELLRRRRTDNE